VVADLKNLRADDRVGGVGCRAEHPLAGCYLCKTVRTITDLEHRTLDLDKPLPPGSPCRCAPESAVSQRRVLAAQLRLLTFVASRSVV
jgi:hypothetical protein